MKISPVSWFAPIFRLKSITGVKLSLWILIMAIIATNWSNRRDTPSSKSAVATESAGAGSRIPGKTSTRLLRATTWRPDTSTPEYQQYQSNRALSSVTIWLPMVGWRATSAGLIEFDRTLHARRLSHANGLLSNSVMSIALLSEQSQSTRRSQSKSQSGSNRSPSLMLATSRGLSIKTQDQMKALTTVQGQWY
jgi:hypothetical protein